MIKKWFFEIKQYFSWFVNRKRIRLAFSFLNENAFSSSQNIMVVSPHADDELLGCYSIMKRYKPTVFLCSLTGQNNSLDNKKRREKEFEACCEYYGVRKRISNKLLVDDLSLAFDKVKPAFVFLPCYLDWHCEHRLVNDIVFDLLSKKGINEGITIVWYPVSIPIPQRLINHLEYLSKKDFREKYGSFKKIYKSQLNINYRRFAFYQKNLLSNKIVESFSLLDLKQWKAIISSLKKEIREADYDSVKQNINNVIYVNDFINKYSVDIKIGDIKNETL